MRFRLSPVHPICILLLALVATGCGQKGPLYHPDAAPPTKSEPAPAPATAAPQR